MAESQCRRICLILENDFDRLYPLIRIYIAQPDLALHVTELAICQDTGRRYQLFRPHQSADGDGLPASHIEVEEYIGRLGLDKDRANAILYAFDPIHNIDIAPPPWPSDPLERRHFRPPPRCSFVDAAIVVLISLCRNISTLYTTTRTFGDFCTFRAGNGPRSVLASYILDCNYNLIPNPGFQNLKYVEVPADENLYLATGEDERSYMPLESLDVFQFFHRLPSIDTITLDGVEEYLSSQKLFVPRTGCMKSICMRHVHLRTSILTTIISIPKALEGFTLSVGGLWTGEGDSPYVDAENLSKALSQHKGSLKRLDLDIDVTLYDSGFFTEDHITYAHEIWDQQPRAKQKYGEEHLRLDKEISLVGSIANEDNTRTYNGTLGSFHDYSALTHLAIGIRSLLGYPGDEFDPPHRLVDVFPAGLEYLCLYGYVKGEYECLDNHVTELIENMNERLPNLKTIAGVDEVVEDVRIKYGHDPAEGEMWKRPKREWNWEI